MPNNSQIDLAIRRAIYEQSGTITNGQVSQIAVPANDNYAFIFLQNPSDQAEPLYVNFGSPASTTAHNSIELLPGSFIQFKIPGLMPTQSINVTAFTTGHPFICKIS